MDYNATLKKSRYVKTGRTKSGYYAYHTLFSNLKTLNDSAYALLEAFEAGAQPGEVLARQGSGPETEAVLRAFHDLYFLCDAKADERQLVVEGLARRKDQLRKGKLIGGLQLSVSNVCNFTCSYCFTNTTEVRRRALPQPTPPEGPKLMSFEVAQRAIENTIALAKRNDRKKIVVKFFGLEPLTNWKTMLRVLEHFRRGEDHGVKITYALTSNGSLVTDEIAATLNKYEVYTTVSIDGTRRANDAVRTSRGSLGTFDQIDNGIALLAKHGVKTNLSAVITEKNFDDVSTDFIDYADGYGSKEVQVLLGMQDDYLGKLTTAQVVDKLYDLYVYGAKKGISVTGYWHNAFAQLYNTTFQRGDEDIVRGTTDSCTATGYQLNIEPSGHIFPCKAMSTHIGHIDQLDEMLASDAYERVVMRTYGNVGECRTCPIEGFCQGECLGNMEQKFDDIYRVDPRYCDIYRGITEKILSNL